MQRSAVSFQLLKIERRDREGSGGFLYHPARKNEDKAARPVSPAFE